MLHCPLEPFYMGINALRWPGRGELKSVQSFARSRLLPSSPKKTSIHRLVAYSTTPRLEIQPSNAPTTTTFKLFFFFFLTQPILWKLVLLFWLTLAEKECGSIKGRLLCKLKQINHTHISLISTPLKSSTTDSLNSSAKI